MYWMKPRCWVCLGKAEVKGPLYTEPCPNPHCPHVADAER